ncbi:MAG: DUF5916 domain-containing protein [Ignavibacteria bacterium]|jgi:hypothetical protein
MKKKLFTILLVLAHFLNVVNAKETEGEAQNRNVKMNTIHISKPITVDGLLNEEVWKSNPGISNFIQRDPDEGETATQKTIVYIAYDNSAAYVAARMYDTHPDSIISRLARRDVDIDTDRFFVYLDPYYDRRSGFYFSLSAAGTQYDGVLYNDDWEDGSWDGVWEGKVNIDSEGWTVEMRIPFSQLRFKDKAENIWGINFKRVIARRNEEDFLVYVPKNESGFVSRFAELHGINNVSSSNGIEILPYITTKAEYSRRDQFNPFNDGSKYTPAVGADFKMALGTNLTLNATVNPDFGQVEIDPAVINLSDGETFFEEKRPFFIEGSTIFDFGTGGAKEYKSYDWGTPNLFYSRRIGRVPQGYVPYSDYHDVPSGTHILGAVKLTGKIFENWNVGAVSALTGREYADYSVNGNKSSVEVEPLTYYGVLRGQKEIDEGKHGLGFISTFTSRMFKDDALRDNINKNAFTGGIDGWTFLDSERTWVVSGWLAMSMISGTKRQMINVQESPRHYFQRPDSKYNSVDSNITSLAGYAGRFYINKQKGNIIFNSAIGFISPTFDMNDIGFQWRSDVVNMHIGTGYFWDQPTSFYRYLELGTALYRTYDYDGDITWQAISHYGNITLPNYYYIGWNLSYNPKSYDNRLTRGGPLSVNLPGYSFRANMGSDSRKNWVVFFNGSVSQRKEDSWSWGLSADIEFRPSSNISFSIGPSYDFSKSPAQYINSFDDPTATSTFNKRYVFGELKQKTVSANIRINWTFTPKLSLQLYAQPMISSGSYINIKDLAKPKTYDFNVYNDIRLEDGTYIIDPDGTGPAEQFSLMDPNFNFVSLRGNAVLRWEYLPGSVVYFVWTQTRSESENIGELQFQKSAKKLVDIYPENIYMVKFTYWFNM